MCSASCGRFLGSYYGPKKETCINPDCKESNDEIFFDLMISLTDETGTLDRCRLSGAFAEQVFNIKVAIRLYIIDR